MKNPEHRRHLLRLAVIAVLIALPAAAEERAAAERAIAERATAERVAQLSKVTGEVEITRAEDDRVDRAIQLGPRVRGGSVFAGDVVATGAGAVATLVFSDGTRVDLHENTRLTVKEVDLSQLYAEGERDKPIGRTIKLLAGEIYSEIVENPEIATEFETPSGVAAVKGTKISLSVRPRRS